MLVEQVSPKKHVKGARKIARKVEEQSPMREAVAKLRDETFRVFYDEIFDDDSRHEEILAEMPGQKKFESESLDIRVAREASRASSKGKFRPEMDPCYQYALLTMEQEMHLFRKMNFLRYRVRNRLDAAEGKFVSEGQVADCRKLMAEAVQIRNLIASCNFRLASTVFKLNLTFYRERDMLLSVVSNAYQDVLKSVDYFDWTIGIKFSTYAVNAIQKNFFTDARDDMASMTYKVQSLSEEASDYIDFKKPSGNNRDGADNRDASELVSTLLGMLSKNYTSPSKVGRVPDLDKASRLVRILEQCYGLNGKEKKKMEAIGKEMGVTKERARQLREQALKWLKSKMVEMGFDRI